MVMNIQELLQRYGHLNRLIGDLRTECITYALDDAAYKDSLSSLKRNKQRLVDVENDLVELGLLNEDARYIDLEVDSEVSC
jgi:hypothetical protein